MFKKSEKGPGIATPEFIVAAAVLLLLEAVLLFQFLVRPHMETAAAKHEYLAAQRLELERFRANGRDADRRKAVLDGLLAQIAEAETMLPPSLHNEDISIDIGRYARANNIKLDSIAFQSRQLVAPVDYTAAAGDGSQAAAAVTNSGGAAEVGVNGAAVADTTGDVSAGAASQSAAVSQSAQTLSLQAVQTAQTLSLQAVQTAQTLSLQAVQISFTSEFHTAGPFIKMFEDGARKLRVRDVTLSRVQEGELKGVLNLEYAALSPTAERNAPGLYSAGEAAGLLADAGAAVPAEESSETESSDTEGAAGSEDGGVGKASIFAKYDGYIEEGADPTILLLSADDDVDADFYMILKSSASNDTKVSYGVYPRVETEVRSNVNNAIRGKLSISGDQDQFEYTYSLASYQKSDKRRLGAVDGVIRLKILSCARNGDDDNVAILLDVENNTELPVEVIVVNDDVMEPRVHLGTTVGTVNLTAG